MGPKFFIYKMREVKSFLQIVRGKIFHKQEDRIEGVNNALDAMKDEKRQYTKERREALKEFSQEKNNRDISGI